jgi:hypothetical protein
MCTPWRDSVYAATPLQIVERTHCIPLIRQYPVVVHALELLQNQGDDKVPCIHHAVSPYHSFGSSVTYFTRLKNTPSKKNVGKPN